MTRGRRSTAQRPNLSFARGADGVCGVGRVGEGGADNGGALGALNTQTSPTLS